jgi:hypothetical protein
MECFLTPIHCDAQEDTLFIAAAAATRTWLELRPAMSVDETENLPALPMKSILAYFALSRRSYQERLML